MYRDETGKEHDITDMIEKLNFHRIVRCKDCKWYKTSDCTCPGMPETWYYGDGMEREGNDGSID